MADPCFAQTSIFASDFPEFVLRLDSLQSAASSAETRTEHHLSAQFFNQLRDRIQSHPSCSVRNCSVHFFLGSLLVLLSCPVEASFLVVQSLSALVSHLLYMLACVQSLCSAGRTCATRPGRTSLASHPGWHDIGAPNAVELLLVACHSLLHRDEDW